MNDRRLVYSTDGDGARHGDGRDKRREKPKPAQKSRPSSPPGFPSDGVVRLSRERGGRGGKVVTVVHGLPASDLQKQAAELKRLCGAGGTLRESTIEIQGDHRERIAERLRGQGYQVKLAGG